MILEGKHVIAGVGQEKIGRHENTSGESIDQRA